MCQAGTYTALCSCCHHVVALPLKVVTLLFSLFVKVIALLVAYFHLTRLLSSHVFAEPHLVVLKHYGKREVLHLIDQMEDCFDHPFEFNPEAIESIRRVRGASACGAWPMGLWHQCVWKKMEVPGQGFREEHLECCYVWVWVRQGIFQGAGIPPQSWGLSARSSKYWAHSIGEAITMRVIALLAFSFCCSGHLVHCIYLGIIVVDLH